MEDPVPAWFWALLPVPIAGLACLLSWFLSMVGGWRRLADSYPDDVMVEGVRFRWQTASFGLASYRGCVTVTADAARLRLSMAFPFRIGHPPISVPWGDIRVEMVRWFFTDIGTFRCAREPDVTVRLRRRLVERLAEASHGQLLIERPADRGRRTQ